MAVIASRQRSHFRPKVVAELTVDESNDDGGGGRGRGRVCAARILRRHFLFCLRPLPRSVIPPGVGRGVSECGVECNSTVVNPHGGDEWKRELVKSCLNGHEPR